jgi:hypothetical protein
VLLQIVSLTRNVGGNLHSVGKTHTSDLPESRVRLLRGGGVNTNAYTALLRACLKR